jgi:hypothetical protein
MVKMISCICVLNRTFTKPFSFFLIFWSFMLNFYSCFFSFLFNLQKFGGSQVSDKVFYEFIIVDDGTNLT